MIEHHVGSPAIVDPFHRGFGDCRFDEMFSRYHQLATVPLICYSQLSQTQQHCLQTTDKRFVKWLSRGAMNEFAAIDSAILRSIALDRFQPFLERVAHTADPLTRRIVLFALQQGVFRVGIDEVATHVGCSMRTLQRRCHDAGIPSPRTLVSLGRLFAVFRLSEWSRQPTGSVAVALGFSNGPNYRRLSRQILGFPPSSVERLGGSQYVARVILRAVRTKSR